MQCDKCVSVELFLNIYEAWIWVIDTQSQVKIIYESTDNVSILVVLFMCMGVCMYMHFMSINKKEWLTFMQNFHIDGCKEMIF